MYEAASDAQVGTGQSNGGILTTVSPGTLYVAGGVGLASLAAAIYLATQGKWGWAAAVFLVLGPLASAGVLYFGASQKQIKPTPTVTLQ